MSDPENFLSRWSRRKREADDSKEATTTPEPSAEETPAAAAAVPPDTLPGQAMPTFDLDSLPSIDSITADTDIRGFFAPGVPAELTRAALRRAWTADPRIRDFVGLAENDWDFNNPSSIPGFGPLEMTDELRREVERIVGKFLLPEEPLDTGAAGSPQATASVSPAQAQERAGQIAAAPQPVLADKTVNTDSKADDPARRSRELLASDTNLRRTEDDTAVQQSDGSRETLQSPARRGHGGALPK